MQVYFMLPTKRLILVKIVRENSAKTGLYRCKEIKAYVRNK